MKFRSIENMREKMWLYVIMIAVGISIYLVFDKIDSIIRSLRCVCFLTTPLILGFAITFLLNRPMELIEVKLLGRLRMKPQHKRSIVIILMVLLGIITVHTFPALLLPQLFDSISSPVEAFPGYVEDFQKFVLDFVEKYVIDTQQVANYITDTDLFKKSASFVTDVLPQMAKATYVFRSTLPSILLSVMTGLYTLIDKERLPGYTKKINHVLSPKEISKYLYHMALAGGDIFNNFIVGKVIDSPIIEILCYTGSLIFQFPYALLLSVIVGVTDMIPVFGSFIGAIPGTVILSVIHPTTALYFALFVFALQQFDDNVLGPLILGDRLGLPSIGILPSVCVGGRLLGIIDMFIGAPYFAVTYMTAKGFISYRLRKEEIDLESISRKMKREALGIEERAEQSEE